MDQQNEAAQIWRESKPPLDCPHLKEVIHCFHGLCLRRQKHPLDAFSHKKNAPYLWDQTQKRRLDEFVQCLVLKLSNVKPCESSRVCVIEK